MLNKVLLVGYLGHDPEIRVTQDGKALATLSLATTTSWKTAQDERQTKTEWHRITVFRETSITWIKESLGKGDLVLVEGKLVYTDKENKFSQRSRATHIVIAGWEGNIQLLRSQNFSSKEAFQGDTSLREHSPRENSHRESSLRENPIEGSSQTLTALNPPPENKEKKDEDKNTEEAASEINETEKPSNPNIPEISLRESSLRESSIIENFSETNLH